MTSPIVSVLIPTFNRAHYVGAAIASALAQTLRDIEVIVADDGSTDATSDLLRAIGDPRLRVVRHERNRGIPHTRNTALAAARGRYIAWLDSDDIARPTRLAEQVAFLDADPAIAMVGACAGKLNPDGTRKGGVRVPPLTPEMIAAWLLFRSAFQQSSVTGRAEVFERYRYDPDYPVCEDVDMFLRLQQEHRLANLPRVLIDRRLHPEQSVRHFQDAVGAHKAQLVRPMLERLGVDADADTLRRHALLGKARFEGAEVEPDFLRWAQGWLRALQEANARSAVLDEASLAFASDYFWALACRAMAPRIGGAAALRSLAARPPVGLATAAAFGWVKAAVPVYLGR